MNKKENYTENKRIITFNYYNALPKFYAKKLKNNYTPDFSLIIPGSFKSAIFNGFDWSKSPEGGAFWEEYEESIDEGKYSILEKECSFNNLVI